MLIKDTFIIEDKTTRTGTNAKGDWSVDEFQILNKKERDDGSILETHLNAVASQNCPKLDVGGTYNLTLFVTIREYNGKYYPALRRRGLSSRRRNNPQTQHQAISTMTSRFKASKIKGLKK
jgi:hypothetical protein